MDAAIYMKAHAGEFDVIIVDSSDPVGPAETLYTSSFYADMKSCLRPGGIVCTQGECLWLHLDLIERVMRDASALYPAVDYAFTTIPTYPSGQIGFILACKDAAPGFTFSSVKRDVPAALQEQLRYYTPQVHSAAFTLPRFAELRLAPVRKSG
jgi:spermidine synthase